MNDKFICDECNRQLKKSETYFMKPKYEEGQFNTFCEKCHFEEYDFYQQNNMRLIIIHNSMEEDNA